MSKPRRLKPSHPCPWQYHPRSDHHSKVACWGVLFDMLLNSELMREHAEAGRIAFGINHTLVDHTNGREKSLDLVICRPRVGDEESARPKPVSFAKLGVKFDLDLSDDDLVALSNLPGLARKPVGTVLVALEAKAAMTAFAKARPRLYDELASSHVVVHGNNDSAIAVGLALINASPDFVSPTMNPCIAYGAPLKTSSHEQPREARLTIEKIRSLPRRGAEGTPGFDAIAAVTVQCRNDGVTAVAIEDRVSHGALLPNDVLHYSTLISRAVGIYASRFPRG